MNAIIMAAGRGTRISRYVDDTCKCTLDIGGITLINHTVEMLLRHDIKVHIVVGFNQQAIRQKLEGLPVTYFTNPFFDVTNSLASLWFAREMFERDEDLILGNADVFWQENILNILKDEQRDAVMLGDSSRNIAEKGDYFFRHDNNRIVAHGKDLDQELITAEYVGLAKVRTSFFQEFRGRVDEMIHAQKHDLWWESALYSFIYERPILMRDIAGMFWMEIDFVEDYERILKFRRGEDPFMEDRIIRL